MWNNFSFQNITLLQVDNIIHIRNPLILLTLSWAITVDPRAIVKKTTHDYRRRPPHLRSVELLPSLRLHCLSACVRHPETSEHCWILTIRTWSELESKQLWGELTAGAFRKPLIAWNTPPPIAPMVKAPPQSSTILQGLQECINKRD